MENILIYSDLHINQSSLRECISVLEEIGMLANKHEVDTLINLGDTFNSLKPSSQEMDVFATFIKRLGTNKRHIILAANSHESTTEEESILNHYGILSDNVQIVKEFQDGSHLYCGHFSIKESASNYDAKFSKEEFKNYLYVYLGHIHSYELIKPNIVHLGSSRYVTFNEAQDKHKIVSLITGYNTESEKVHFMKLKSPIPMIQIELGIKSAPMRSNATTQEEKEAVRGKESGFLRQFEGISEITSFLDKTDPKTKVKVVIHDFENFRKFLPFCRKYDTKFATFKYDTSFEFIQDNTQKGVLSETKSFKESFTIWLKNQTINPEIVKILQKEVE